MGKNTLKNTSEWLMSIGAINWGLGLFNINLVTGLTGMLNLPVLSNILYGLIGASGVYWLYNKFK